MTHFPALDWIITILSLAAYSVTSPHTIPEDFGLERLLTFAHDHGVSFAGALGEVRVW